jgi:AcrR family transcriptional regulator
VTPAAPPSRRANRRPQAYVMEAQRRRILSAMVHVACEDGAASATVTRVMRRARVSRSAFYAFFEDRSHCLLEAFEEAVALASKPAIAAYEGQEMWADRVRAGLCALLRFFDESPELAQLCVVQVLAAPPAVLARRAEVLDQLARVIEEGGETSSREVSPVTAEAVVGGALGVLHARLLRSGSGPLVELLNPVMSIVVQPYLGGEAARRELARSCAEDTPAVVEYREAFDPLEGVEMRLTYRALEILVAIADQPGLSNRAVGYRAGVPSDTQISKILGRLARVGLIQSAAEGRLNGGANAWRLTIRGKQVARATRRDFIAQGADGELHAGG